MPTRKRDLPSTIQRSDEHARAVWAEAHDSAVKSYGEGERAHRTAFAALKHSYEKVGDHWEAKTEKGPSDAQAARRRPGPARGKTAEGVDANASKAHLLELAKRLDVSGRSKMSKDELVDALKRANRRATAKARG
jgi:cation transport regulator ChaB